MFLQRAHEEKNTDLLKIVINNILLEKHRLRKKV